MRPPEERSFAMSVGFSSGADGGHQRASSVRTRVGLRVLLLQKALLERAVSEELSVSENRMPARAHPKRSKRGFVRPSEPWAAVERRAVADDWVESRVELSGQMR